MVFSCRSSLVIVVGLLALSAHADWFGGYFGNGEPVRPTTAEVIESDGDVYMTTTDNLGHVIAKPNKLHNDHRERPRPTSATMIEADGDVYNAVTDDNGNILAATPRNARWHGGSSVVPVAVVHDYDHHYEPVPRVVPRVVRRRRDVLPNTAIEEFPDIVTTQYKDLSQPDEVQNEIEHDLGIGFGRGPSIGDLNGDGIIDVGFGLEPNPSDLNGDGIVDIGFGLEPNPTDLNGDGFVDVGFGLEPNYPINGELPLVRPYVPNGDSIVDDFAEDALLPAVQPVYSGMPHGHGCNGHGRCRPMNSNFCLCACNEGYHNNGAECIATACAEEDFHCQESVHLQKEVTASLLGRAGMVSAELDVITGQHFAPGRHSAFHLEYAPGIIACEAMCVNSHQCHYATFEQTMHQCSMFNVRSEVLVIEDFQAAAEAVLLVKRHYNVRHNQILVGGTPLGVVRIVKTLPSSSNIMALEAPGRRILVDYNANNEDVFKACEQECNGVPRCQAIMVRFSRGLCKLFGNSPHFRPASAIYNDVWSGIKEETAQREIVDVGSGAIVGQGPEFDIPEIF